MYAIVEIAGQQFKVEKDQQLFVHRLEAKEGAKVSFDNVLLIDNKGKVNVGAPAITGANVSAKVLEHLKDDKVIVFKKKRRKGYKVKNGHRQYLTKIQIESISEKGGAKPAAKKAVPKVEDKVATPKAEEKTKTTAKKETATKAPAKKAEAKTETKKAAPKAAAKKAPAKKAATKKTTTKKADDSAKK
jgi:large subunit ribosomal protein L21